MGEAFTLGGVLSDEKRLLHEDLTRKEQVKVGSERSFGLTIGAVFAIVAGILFWSGGSQAVWWLGGAVAFAGLGLLLPRSLRLLHPLLSRVRLLLHLFVRPLVLG